MSHWALKIACTSSMLFVVYLIAKLALADFYYERSLNNFKPLNLEQLEHSSELDSITDDVDRSLALRRSSANTLDLKADLLYQSWWVSPDAQYFNESHLLRSAAALHLEANQHRKGWAFNAARLAVIYSHQRHLEQEFNYWFSESHRLGLYETKVARSMMILGLQHWSQLTPVQQSMTSDFIRTSVEQKSNSLGFISSLLNQHKKREYVCSSSDKTTRMTKMCEPSL